MLSYLQFAKLFPFHFVLDRSMRIVSVGPVLVRVCPKAAIGAHFSHAFTLDRFGLSKNVVFDAEFICKQALTLFIFKTADASLSLRCQVVILDDPELYVFLGSPWVRKANELAAMHLTLSDFALHDSTVDLLQLMQTSYVSVRDAKELAKRLELQRDDIQGMIDSANAPIFGLDLQGCVTEWNRATEAILSTTKTDALGKQFVEHYVDHQSRERVVRLANEVAAGKSSDDLECTLMGSSGKPVLMLLSGSPRHGPDGGVVGMILIGKNITSLVEYRTELETTVAERTAALENANAQLSGALRAKDDFLSAMSHELRTPLNAILGLSESLLEGVYGAINDRQVQSLTMIAESGGHLLALINDLLDLAKVGAGKMEVSVAETSIRELCAASVRFVQQQADKKKIVTTITWDPAVEMVVTDPRRMLQVLVNLLSNAVKFTPDGGRIVLSVTGRPEQRVVALAVADTGIGISEADLAGLFVPFKQIDSKLSRKYSGTGLGLNLVRRLTELLGGQVSIQSKLGVGSTFTITIPWDPPQVDAGDGTSRAHRESLADAQGIAMAGVTGPLVLIVDDDHTNQTMLTDYLLSNGFRVATASNGVEGIRSARLRLPRVILMDMQMPVMNGLEAMRELRSASAFDQVPIIALTSNAMPGDRDLCLEAGANAYLSKPIQLRELVNTIRKALTDLPSI